MDFLTRLFRLRVVSFLKKWKLVGIILGTIDILSITVAFQISYLINNYNQANGDFFFFSDTILVKLFALILPVWLVVLYLMQVTEIPRAKRYRTLFFEYMVSAMVVAVLLLLFYFIFNEFNISRRFLVEFVFLGFAFLFVTRLIEYRLFQTYRAKGFSFLNIAVIADESSISFIDRIINTPVWGFRISIIFTDSDSVRSKYENSIEMLPLQSLDLLTRLMADSSLDEIFYLKEKINASEIRKIIRSCEEFGVIFRLITKEKQSGLTNAYISNVANEKFLTFSNIPHKSFSLGIKKFMDINLSLIALILLSPLILFICVAIYATSKGPVLYTHERVGLRGRIFRMYKFRTMVVNADEIKHDLISRNEMDGPAFKIKDDPRITRIGKFLRRTGLDELPQLFNVIKGEMSLVGPRPPLWEETLNYETWQLRRLSVKPGLSCFWQVKPERNNIKFEKWMEMDLAYIDNWSLRLDFYIMFKTIASVFNRSGM